MIELRDVSFTFDGAPSPVLRDVDLSIEESELALVAGRTGSGKSTLLGMLNGLVPRFTGGTLDGDVMVGGQAVREHDTRDLAHIVGYVGQDPLAGFVTDLVEDELAYGMEQLGVDARTMRRRVEETLDLLGIADLRSRALRTLSGGQQQRVAIGAALTMHPSVLVLDEPTSALDPTAAEDVIATLARLVDDLGVTVVLAEHRMERVVPVADRLVLVDGRGVRSGEPRQLLRDAPLAPPLVRLGRLARWEPLPLTVREARRSAGGWRPAEPTPVVGPDATPLLTARRIVVRHGSTVAVRDVDLDLPAGRVTVLMGRNGSGKSSLLWALQGSGRRQSGRVDVRGTDPAEVRPAQRRALVGLVPQTAGDLLYLETVDLECAAADEQTGVPAGTCRTLFDRLAPGVVGSRHPRDLSEGQRLALVLAIVLTASPKVVALDEPTRGLDYEGKDQLVEILRDLAADGHGVVLATHDVEFAARVADTVHVMAEGEVVSSGPTVDVLSESPAFAPQVTKVLGPPWLTVEQVAGVRS